MLPIESEGQQLVAIQQLVRSEFERLLSENFRACPVVVGSIESASCPGKFNSATIDPNLRLETGCPDQSTRLPSPERIRNLIKKRQARRKYFASDLFGEPVWDMLLELALSEAERKPIAVTSLCIGSGVPASTALRWINLLCERGICRREGDGADRRRSYVSLSDQGRMALEQYFQDFPL